MDNNHTLTSRANAAYVLFIMPPDSDSNGHYKVQEFYTNGKPKIFSTSINRLHIPILAGSCIIFYPNGHRKSITNYNNGVLNGNATFYYPNGKLYAIKNYDKSGQVKLIESRDSTGNILCENRNGKWVRYSDDLKVEFEEGAVKDSLEDGKWYQYYYPAENYTTIYSRGEIISSTDPERAVGEIIYNDLDIEPEYKGGILNFYRFLGATIRYPSAAKENNTQGKVLVTFVVKKDGTLTDIKILKNPAKILSDEALRAVKLSPPWTPGLYGGRPVLVQYTAPISFTLSSD